MKGDFTRDTFRPGQGYSSVRMQQGRVQMDADWNEAEDIRLARERTEVADLLGPSGAPIDDAGFAIAADFGIGAGRLYVEGLLCENPAPAAYTAQPYAPGDPLPEGGGTLLVFLEAWEEHVTALEDPLVREVALLGPDTGTRLRPVWRVRAVPVNTATAPATCATAMSLLPGSTDARLSARARIPDDTAACTVMPGASYRRLENQLYRVEVHDVDEAGKPLFKWSRDNGAVASGFSFVDASTLTVDRVGRDGVLSFQAGGWVEITDRPHELLGEPGQLVDVQKIDGNRLVLQDGTTVDPTKFDATTKKARRWDSPGAIPFVAGDDGFMALEDGVEVAITGTSFRKGDYWLIPARTVTGDVEWPFDAPQPPHGVVRRRAPLAIATLNDSTWDVRDCRAPFVPLSDVIALSYVGGDGQTATTDPTGALILRDALTVGVSRGRRPVAGASVRWTVLDGGGAFAAPATTDANGLATCAWTPGVGSAAQHLRADLLDADGTPIHLPILFTANLPPTTGGSAGLCHSVGQGGDFLTIEEAAQSLVVKGGQTAVCLSLLPGDHPWPDLAQVKAPDALDLTLVGIGAASSLTSASLFQVASIARFALKDLTLNADAGIAVNNVVEFDLTNVSVTVKTGFGVQNASKVQIRDCGFDSDTTLGFTTVDSLAITGTSATVVTNGHGLYVNGGTRLDVERCVLNSLTQGAGATLCVGGMNVVQVRGNEISGRRSVRRGLSPLSGAVATTSPAATATPAASAPAVAPTGAPLVVGNDAVGGFVGKVGAGLTPAAVRSEAKRLIGASSEVRVANADALNTFVAGNAPNLGRDGAVAVQNLTATLKDPNADAAKVQDAIGKLNVAIGDPKIDTGFLAVFEVAGTALQFDDGRSDANVEGNLLRGALALYGAPSGEHLAQPLSTGIEAVQARLGIPYVVPGTGNLHLSRNTLANVLLSGALAQALDSLQGAFQTAQTLMAQPSIATNQAIWLGACQAAMAALTAAFAQANAAQPLFLTVTVSDNVLSAPLDLAASAISFTGNVFRNSGAAGTFMGTVAVTGNIATAGVTLSVPTPPGSKAATGNLGVTVA